MRLGMGRAARRVIAVGALAAGAAAGSMAVMSALGGSTATIAQAKAADATLISYHPVSFGRGEAIGVRKHGSRYCFTVRRGTSTLGRGCTGQLAPDGLEYASSRYAVGGLAGGDVRAVIVKLTHRGTVWATLRHGAFYAAVPKGHRPRAVIKVLAGGARRTFTVTTSR
jgi:hypothetical protein